VSRIALFFIFLIVAPRSVCSEEGNIVLLRFVAANLLRFPGKLCFAKAREGEIEALFLGRDCEESRHQIQNQEEGKGSQIVQLWSVLKVALCKNSQRRNRGPSEQDERVCGEGEERLLARALVFLLFFFWKLIFCFSWKLN
jgi:hypothetical protein